MLVKVHCHSSVQQKSKACNGSTHCILKLESWCKMQLSNSISTLNPQSLDVEHFKDRTQINCSECFKLDGK